MLGIEREVECERQVPPIAKQPAARLMPPVLLNVEVAVEKLMPFVFPTERREPGVVVEMPRCFSIASTRAGSFLIGAHVRFSVDCILDAGDFDVDAVKPDFHLFEAVVNLAEAFAENVHHVAKHGDDLIELLAVGIFHDGAMGKIIRRWLRCANRGAGGPHMGPRQEKLPH